MTLTIEVQNPTGVEAVSRTIELPAEVFDVDTNLSLIHQVVVGQLAAARQGTHSTKTRADVRGGGRKPYRQKGTGRARQGSTRAPQFAGGGVVHGPHPRDYEQRTPKKMKAAALRQALSDRARNGRVHVITALLAGETPSTKGASVALSSISSARNVLFVAGRDDELSWKSLRNVDVAHVIEPGQLNTYDVLISDDVVFTQAALEEFVETRGNGASLTITEGDAPTKAAPAKNAPASKAETATAETPTAEAKKVAAAKAEPAVADDVKDES
jgi:large subunit ribosomal protein L4